MVGVGRVRVGRTIVERFEVDKGGRVKPLDRLIGGVTDT